MSKEEKSSLWSQRIREFRSSGQTCKDWCGEHQLPVSTMTYWIRKLKREEAADDVDRFKVGGIIQHPVSPQELPQEESWV